jgi:Mat/Ecp fimbriae major subunit
MMGHSYLGVTLLALPLALVAAPAAAETAPAETKARILRPIHFAILLEMDFGQVIAGAGGGTVVLNPVDASRDCTAGGLSCTGSHSVARLNLSGSDAIVTVTYDPSFTLTGPGAPMTVTPLFVGGSGSQIAMTGGAATVEFGAELTVNAGQLDGTYTGEFTVNVNYN